MKLDTEIRRSYTGEATHELNDHLNDLKGSSKEDLILLGISLILEKLTNNNRYLSLKTEALRLTINKGFSE